MVDDDREPSFEDRTTEVLQEIGSLVYERAVSESGPSEALMRAVLKGALASVGMSPQTLTIEELAALLPQIEERMRKLFDPSTCSDTMRRLQSLILSWEA
jgi:hypothetical protein